MAEEEGHSDRDVFERDLFDRPAVEGFTAPLFAETEADGTLLERYRDGDNLGAWAALRRRGPLAGAARDEAQALAAETMARVARNADILSERLSALGWRALSGGLRSIWSDDGADAVQALAGASGAPIPLSVAAFWRHVGGIDLIWDYKTGPPPALFGLDRFLWDRSDALAVAPASAFVDVIEDWRERADWYAAHTQASVFPIDLAPDIHHKANISGGAPYAIHVPTWESDPILVNAPIEEPFTDYLRRAFQWGGFPGLEPYGDEPNVVDLVGALTEGLQPF